MKQTKHFKRTAFNLSAKSMASLMLLLIAMLVPQGVWATDFISEIKYAVHETEKTAFGYLSGYTRIDGQLNNNPTKSGERWVYMGYKTSTDPSKAITDIMVVSGSSYLSGHLESDNSGNNYVTFTGDSRKWYRCPSQGESADINKGNGGDDLCIYYTRDGNTTNGKSAITTLAVVNETGLSGWTYAKLFKNSSITANGNTNEGTDGGTPTYIVYKSHTHSYTAAFNWATDGKSCTATVSCSCGDTHSDLACTVTSATKTAATCTEKGWTTYKAEITSNGKNFSGTKDVQDIAALGHSYTSQTATDTYLKSAATCTADAVYYHKCSRCDSKGTTTWTKTGTALGHSYGAGSWSWADDGHSATCTRTCGRTGCTTNTTGHTSSKSVTLGNGITSAQRAAPTCITQGTTRYTATATVEGTQYSATKDVVDIAALGHGSTGYTPTYTWGGTYDAATCTFTLHCGSCGVEVFNDNITTTKVDANHVDATCCKDGKERWTATGSYSKTGDAQYNGTAQVNDYAIPATGLHTFNEETDPHHTLCTVCDHSFFRYTSSTGKAVDPWDANALKDAYDAKLDFTNTYVDGQGVMEFNGTLKTIGAIAFSYRLDFIGDLTIPNSVTSIGSSAFQGCEGFTGALTIPNSVTSIEKQAFARCSNLTGNLTIPNSVTSIEKQAFARCSNLTGNLTIPNSVTSIGGEAFTSCSGFTGIEFQSVPQIGSDAFNKVNCPKTVVLSDDSYVYTGENPDFPEVSSVTYNRIIVNDGGKYSFVVPFDIPAAQAAQLGTFYQYRTHGEGKVHFDNIARVGEGIVRANTAYFFEPAKDITSITVENPTFGTTGTMPDATNPSEPGLYGTYSQIDIPVGAYGYVIQGGESTFVKSGTGNLLRPFRAYLWLGSGASMAKARAFFGEEEANGIFDIDAESERVTPTYDLNGRRVNDGYKGIVIKNGKKIIVK